MDSPFIGILIFYHAECWKQYRADGKLYPMPKYAGYTDEELSSLHEEILKSDSQRKAAL